jgi:hypothetical protein
MFVSFIIHTTSFAGDLFCKLRLVLDCRVAKHIVTLVNTDDGWEVVVVDGSVAHAYWIRCFCECNGTKKNVCNSNVKNFNISYSRFKR